MSETTGKEVMTDDDLTAMESLAAKATAGPWEWLREWELSPAEHGRLVESGGAGICQNGSKFDIPKWIASLRHSEQSVDIRRDEPPVYDGPVSLRPDDAAFIAAARQFVPDAIAEIRRLRAELSYLRSTGATNVE